MLEVVSGGIKEEKSKDIDFELEIRDYRIQCHYLWLKLLNNVYMHR